MWPFSSGDCFSVRHGTGLVNLRPKASTQATPERTGFDSNPRLGARKTWTRFHSWADLATKVDCLDPDGQKTSKALKLQIHPSSWEQELLPKKWKPIERKRNVSIDSQGLVLIYILGSGPEVIYLPLTARCHQQCASSESPWFSSPIETSRAVASPTYQARRCRCPCLPLPHPPPECGCNSKRTSPCERLRRCPLPAPSRRDRCCFLRVWCLPGGFPRSLGTASSLRCLRSTWAWSWNSAVPPFHSCWEQ